MEIKMITIQVAYSLRIEGTQFNEEIDFLDTTPEFSNIILKPIDEENCKYELLIKKNVYPSDISLEISPQLMAILEESYNTAEKFKYIFSISANVKIFDFEFLGYDHDGKLTKYNQIFGYGDRLSASGTCTLIAGNRSAINIKEKMKIEYNLPLIQMFYDATTIIEPVGRFISLYTLLLHKFSDKQENVDEEILKIDPTVAQFRSPHNKGYETIFTKLRNEMSHKREGSNILKTQDFIKMNLDRFEKIVWNVIEKDIKK